MAEAAVLPNAETKTPETTPQTTSQSSSEERPAWLPEKFKTAEDLAKAYGELEKKQGAKPEAPSQKTDATPADAPTDSQQIELAKYQKEFSETGKLSEDSLKDLEKKGISRDVVDFYTKSFATQTAGPDLSVVGGEDAFKEIANWAKANLSQAEIDAYNEGLRSGPAGSRFALLDLKTKFQEAVGVEPHLVGGKSTSVEPGYRSIAEMEKAMADPRYEKDPAYRNDVYRKLERTKGII